MTAGPREGWLVRTWSIALFGHVNPAIITADWLDQREVLAPDEVASAIEKSETGAATLSIPPLLLEVTLERFLVQTDDPASVARLADVVAAVFDVLMHTPIASVALGFDGEWLPARPEDRRALLDRFVPAPTLTELGPIEARSATLRLEGLSGAPAVAHLTVEDSDAEVGAVYVSVVDELDVVPTEGRPLAGAAVDAVRDRAADFFTAADSLADKVVVT